MKTEKDHGKWSFLLILRFFVEKIIIPVKIE